MSRSLKVAIIVALIMYFTTRDGMTALMAAASTVGADLVASVF